MHVLTRYYTTRGRVRGMLAMDSLFPEATSFDIVKTKMLLTRYKKIALDLEGFRTNPPETERQQRVFDDYSKISRTIERAVNLIIDAEIRSIIQYRYIEGNPRKAAVIRFSLITDRTLDRKINEGIESVANTLKLWGEI